MQFYYTNHENGTIGPVNKDALDDLLKQGVITHSSAVIAEGDNEWGTYHSYNSKHASQPATPKAAPVVTENSPASIIDSTPAVKAAPVSAFRQKLVLVLQDAVTTLWASVGLGLILDADMKTNIAIWGAVWFPVYLYRLRWGWLKSLDQPV